MIKSKSGGTVDSEHCTYAKLCAGRMFSTCPNGDVLRVTMVA